MTTGTVGLDGNKTLTFTFQDGAGALADPTSIALTIQPPTGAAVAKTDTDMTNTSLGVWTYVHTFTLEGRWFFYVDGDGTVEAAGTIEIYCLQKQTGTPPP